MYLAAVVARIALAREVRRGHEEEVDIAGDVRHLLLRGAVQALARLCPVIDDDCMVCAGQRQRALRAAMCAQNDIVQYCDKRESGGVEGRG